LIPLSGEPSFSAKINQVTTGRAVALEVATADREVKVEETRFLEMLSDSLELDKLITAGIERGIRARNLVL
jgi:uncharacterized membrane protein YebE (DUF533 family)